MNNLQLIFEKFPNLMKEIREKIKVEDNKLKNIYDEYYEVCGNNQILVTVFHF